MPTPLVNAITAEAASIIPVINSGWDDAFAPAQQG
jgi:hypothetical protein